LISGGGKELKSKLGVLLDVGGGSLEGPGRSGVVSMSIISDGALGSGIVSDVNVGTEGKYPPPNEPFLASGEGWIGDTTSLLVVAMLYGKPSLGYGSNLLLLAGLIPGDPAADGWPDGCKVWLWADCEARCDCS